jgi:hypothetical protein
MRDGRKVAVSSALSHAAATPGYRPLWSGTALRRTRALPAAVLVQTLVAEIRNAQELSKPTFAGAR